MYVLPYDLARYGPLTPRSYYRCFGIYDYKQNAMLVTKLGKSSVRLYGYNGRFTYYKNELHLLVTLQGNQVYLDKRIQPRKRAARKLTAAKRRKARARR